MIMFGTYETLVELISYGCNNMAVFNLSGYKEGFVPLRILPFDNNSVFFSNDEVVNDLKLLEYIYNNDSIFFEFFSKVLYPFYSGVNVYLIISGEDIAFEIALSIMKIIQQRYGYNPVYLSNVTDFAYVSQNCDMNINGIYNFDQDKNRYMGMVANSMGIPKTDTVDNPDQIADNLLLY